MRAAPHSPSEDMSPWYYSDLPHHMQEIVLDEMPREQRFDYLADKIGNTPVFPGSSYLPNTGVITKREFFNPSGSHYDRAFFATLKSFEESGFIQPGDELRDITSGSGGISLAFLGNVLGYKVRITVPDELPDSRLMPMRMLEAEIVNAGPGYMQTASTFQAEEIRRLKDDPEWELSRPDDRDQRAFAFKHRTTGERICYLNHSENRLTVDAFSAIGHEAVQQLATPPTAVALAMGNWTSIAGISPVIREAWPDTRIIGYEGTSTQIHNNFGTSVEGIPLRFRDDALIDEIMPVSDELRDEIGHRVNSLLIPNAQIGHSSLMGLVVGEIATQLHGGQVLTIAYDQKVRY